MADAAASMNHHAPCALRTHRRTWGLSQRELADLLGFESPTHVSRLEHGKRVPGFETALACSTLFGVSLYELFPQFAEQFGDALRERITHLQEGSHHATTPLEMRKRELLDRAIQGTADQGSRADL
jgi:transcriptional regulator with XRE-family HTH domain